VYGKIKKIRRLSISTKPDLEFLYDASGNRIAKIEKPHGSSKENGGTDIVTQWKTTYYVRDAQGNVMGNYYHNPTIGSFKLIERDLYGSDRLGTENTQIELISALPLAQPFTRILGNKYFEGKNHLGNVLSVFTDKKIPRDDDNNGVIDYFQPEVLACNDYTAFGAPMNERTFSSNKYRYGFNGKEKDDEVVGNGNEYDYGARIYNPRLGRFLSTDPLSHKFPYWSPYQFAGNTPIQAIDLDGREILFVNGHYQDNWFGRNVLGADKPGKAYWGTGFTEAAQKFFNDRTPITSSNYINGSSSIGIDESGSDRFTRGYNYAKANLSTITAGYVKSQSEFKIVTHSEGAAYGAGIAQALIEEGWKVGTIVHLSADEGDEFSTPKGPTTYQFGYDGDWVTGNKQIEGTDKSGEGNSDALGWDEVHGATKSASVFKKVEDLKSVTTQENIDKNGKGHTTQKQGSAPNGTKFTKINDQKVTK
jgi:RHS repeat-associated protein